MYGRIIGVIMSLRCTVLFSTKDKFAQVQLKRNWSGEGPGSGHNTAICVIELRAGPDSKMAAKISTILVRRPGSDQDLLGYLAA